jgi:hypothetical protein
MYLLKAKKPIEINDVSQKTRQEKATNSQRPGLLSKKFLPASTPTAVNESTRRLIKKSAIDKLNTNMFETVFNSFVHNIAPTITIFPNIPIIVEKQAKNVYGKYSPKF